MPVAIGTLAMLVGNVGLQVLNNWCNSRQNNQLQQKQKEFEQAARDHQTERMWQIMREGQNITLELEKARHNQRIKELGIEMDQILISDAYRKAIESWPLKVLPIVMKNQAFGNLLTHQEESFALHCILTPSNSSLFNRHVFPYVEKALEDYCNQYWSIVSSHPILFYSGAWKVSKAPMPPQLTSMKKFLGNIPTMLITPFFRPNGKLVFRLRIWGLGATSDNSTFCQITEIEPEGFRHEYLKDSDYDKVEHLLENAISEIVPYLQCMIGYIADTYFWSSSGLTPLLPLLLSDGSINTTGMEYLLSNSSDYYEKLLLSGEENVKKQPFSQDNLVNLYEGSAELWDEKQKNEMFEKLLFGHFNNRIGRKLNSISELGDSDCKFFDIWAVDKLIRLCPNEATKKQLNEFKEKISHQPLNLKIRRIEKLTLKDVIEKACSCLPENADKWHLFQDKCDGYLMVASFFSKADEVVYKQPSDIILYITKQFVVPHYINLNDGIDASINQLKEMAELLTIG